MEKKSNNTWTGEELFRANCTLETEDFKKACDYILKDDLAGDLLMDAFNMARWYQRECDFANTWFLKCKDLERKLNDIKARLNTIIKDETIWK